MIFRKILTISVLGAGLCVAVPSAACLAGDACEAFRDASSPRPFRECASVEAWVGHRLVLESDVREYREGSGETAESETLSLSFSTGFAYERTTHNTTRAEVSSSPTVSWAEGECPGPECTYWESPPDGPYPSAGDAIDDEPFLFVWVPDMGTTVTDPTFVAGEDPHAGYRARKNEAVDRMNRLLEEGWSNRYP